MGKQRPSRPLTAFTETPLSSVLIIYLISLSEAQEKHCRSLFVGPHGPLGEKRFPQKTGIITDSSFYVSLWTHLKNVTDVRQARAIQKSRVNRKTHGGVTRVDLVFLLFAASAIFLGESAAKHAVTFAFCEWRPRSTAENMSRCVVQRPKLNLHTTPFCLPTSPRPWISGRKGLENPRTSTLVLSFVVGMRLKRHLLGLNIRYRGRLGREPVFSERLCPRKKKHDNKKRAKNSTKIQTLKRPIGNKVKMS